MNISELQNGKIDISNMRSALCLAARPQAHIVSQITMYFPDGCLYDPYSAPHGPQRFPDASEDLRPMEPKETSRFSVAKGGVHALRKHILHAKCSGVFLAAGVIVR